MLIAVFVQSYLRGTPKRAGLRHSGNVTPILMIFSIVHIDVYTVLVVNWACCLAVLHVCNHLAHFTHQKDIRQYSLVVSGKDPSFGQFVPSEILYAIIKGL